jgi:hypothetical protein
MNAVVTVQFIRNALLCCIKDLELYRDSVLYDAKILRSVHDYPPYTKKNTIGSIDFDRANVRVCHGRSIGLVFIVVQYWKITTNPTDSWT